jgi:uncharacterized protein YbjT (DUF2867 family)
MSNTILITAASGTIGRELVEVLKAHRTRFIAGTSSGKTIADVETRRTDFADQTGLVQSFTGVDTLFLLLPLQANMVELARNAVSAAKAAGVRHIVRSSVAGADAASRYPIASVHGEIDQLVIDSGMSYTVTRPSSFMQNYVNFYSGMLKAGALYLAQGSGAISLIDARDIASANATVLLEPAQHANKIYTLTGPEALSNSEITAIVGAASGKPVRYISVPEEAAQSALRKMGMDEWMVNVMTSLNQLIAAGHAEGISPDLQSLTRQKPRTFSAFAEEHALAWK